MSLPNPVYQIKMLAMKRIYPAAFLGQVFLEKCQIIIKTEASANKNMLIKYMHPLPRSEMRTKSKIAKTKQ